MVQLLMLLFQARNVLLTMGNREAQLHPTTRDYSLHTRLSFDWRISMCDRGRFNSHLSNHGPSSLRA